MLNIIETSKAIEKVYYTLSAIKAYTEYNSDLEEILPVKYSLDLIIKDLDKIYAKIIDSNLI